MDLATDALERIFAAADSLYEQAACSGFPTVDAVRKTALVNVNDISVSMKQWRRVHMLPAVPMAAQVIGKCPAGGSDYLGGIAARCTAEAETRHMQLYDAFEVQAAELDAAMRETARLRAKAGELLVAKAAAYAALQDACRDLASTCRCLYRVFSWHDQTDYSATSGTRPCLG